ncbi:MAG: tetratricopeptide repeat protein [Candidatus Melainabacteria bacterium]|nr:tetratricopeptide repeat protein [Candidatus Melainabacteria bacterium]
MRKIVVASILAVSTAFSMVLSQPCQARGSEMSTLSHKKIFKGRVTNAVSQGSVYLQKRDYDKAADSFRKAINRNSRDVDAINGLGLALALQFKLDGAEEQFKRAESLDPNNPVTKVGKAILTRNRLQSSNNTYRQNKKALLEQAEADCKSAIASDPNMPEAHAVLGLVYKEQDRLDDAASELRIALKNDPSYGFVLTHLGIVELDQGNVTDAMSHLKRAIALDSKNSTAHYGLGRAYLAQNDVNAALKELNTSAALFPNSAPVNIAFGDAYSMQGNFVAAVQKYKEAVRIKPEMIKAYLSLADIREARGDLEFAIADLRSGIELNPENSELQTRIGELSLQAEKVDDSIKAFKKALELDNGNTRAVDGLTRAYYVKTQKDSNGAFFVSNDFEEAEKSINEAIRLNPNSLQLRLAAAKLRALSGKPVDLNTVGQPTNDAERISYAEALLAQDRFDESAQQMQMVVNNTSDQKQLFALADLAVTIRDFPSAEAAYKKAGTTNGGAERSKRGLHQVETLQEAANRDFRLANDLARKKQRPSAIDNFKKAAYENPRLAEARLGLADTIEKSRSKDPAQLREAARQYKAYLGLKKDLPEKEQRKYQKKIEKLELAAYKIEQRTLATH